MMVNGEIPQTLNVKRYSFLKEKKRYKNVKRCSKAQYLVDKFKKAGCEDADNCYYYFVKCFNELPESTIWNIFETATSKNGVKSPIKYFIGACRNQMS
jgi:hypothetical protein